MESQNNIIDINIKNMTTLTNKAIALSIATITLVVSSGVVLLAPISATPGATAQTYIRDGALIRAHNTEDVYIVKTVGTKSFKRLILNAAIFDSYAHLSWSNIINVSPATLNQYRTSNLVMEVRPNGVPVNGKIFRLEPSGRDTGVKRYLNLTTAEFVAAGLDRDSIYGINHIEASGTFYQRGADLTPADFGLTRTYSPQPQPRSTYNPQTVSTPVIRIISGTGSQTVGVHTVPTTGAVTTPTSGRTTTPTPGAVTTPTSGSQLPTPGTITTPTSGSRLPTPTGTSSSQYQLNLQQVNITQDIEFGEDDTLTVLKTKLSASNTSDISVTRVNVGLVGLGGNDKDTNPARTFSTIELFVGDELVARRNLSTSSFVKQDNTYSVLLSGVNMFSIPAGTSVDMQVKLTTKSTLTTSRHQSWEVMLQDNAVRGTNERFQYAYARGTVEQQFVVVEEDTSTTSGNRDGTLRVVKNNDIDWADVGPGEQRTVMSLDLTAQESDISLSQLRLSLQGPQNADIRRTFAGVNLFVDNSRKVSRTNLASSSDATLVFNLSSSNNPVVIQAGETRILDVKVATGSSLNSNDRGVWVVGFASQGIKYTDEAGTSKQLAFTQTNRFNTVNAATEPLTRDTSSELSVQQVHRSTATLNADSYTSVLDMQFSEGDADITLDRIQLEFEALGGSGKDKRPWKSFDDIQIVTRAGTNGVGPDIASFRNVNISDFVKNGNKYTITLDDIDHVLGPRANLKAYDNLSFFVRVWSEPNLNAADHTQDWTIHIPDNGVQGTDERNNRHYAGGISNTFAVKGSTQSTDDDSDNDITLKRLSSPSSAEIEEGDTRYTPVISVELTPGGNLFTHLDSEGDETKVVFKAEKLKIRFEAQGSSDQDDKPWETFSRIRILAGEDQDLVARKYGLVEENFTNTGGGSYELVLDLTADDIKVRDLEVNENRDLKLTVALRTYSSLNNNDHTQEWEIQLGRGAVCGKDGLLSTICTTGSAIRSFEVDASGDRPSPSSQDDSDVVRIRLDSDTPASQSVRASTARTTNNVELLRFNVQNTSGVNLDIDDLEVRLTSNAALEDVVRTAELYDSRNNLLRSVPITSSSSAELVRFRNLDIGLRRGDILEFIVKVDVERLTNNDITLYARATSASFDRQDIEVRGTATGNTLSFVVNTAPIVSLRSSRVTYPQTLSDGQSDRTLIAATFVLDVTAQGGDVYLPKNCGASGSRDNGFIISVPQLIDSNGRDYSEIACAGIADPNSRFRIRAGDTASITLKAHIQQTGTQSGQGTGSIWTSVAPTVAEIQYSESMNGSLQRQDLTGLSTEPAWLLSKNWNAGS